MRQTALKTALPTVVKLAVALLVLHSLAACGGGGGGSSAPPTYTIGVTVSGLAGAGLVLQNNGGGNLAIPAAGSFTFSTALASGTAYSVTVLTQPINPSQTCTVAAGTGMATGNVTSVAVTCTTNTYTVGGNVSGLTGTGLVLQDNAGDDLNASSGPFAFVTKIASGATFNVKVSTQPTHPDQICTVSNGNGTVTNAHVSIVAIACSAVAGFAYTAGGLSGSISVFAILASTGDLFPLPGNPVAVGGGCCTGVAVNPARTTVYVASETPANIFAYSLNANGGGLAALSGNPFTGVTYPAALAITPNGSFAYAANLQGSGLPISPGGVSAFFIGATGALTSVAGSPFAGDGPISVVVGPSGQVVYAANLMHDTISAYAINPATGALTEIAGSPFAAGHLPYSMTVDATGKFFFVANDGGNVSAYSIDPTTGSISAVSGSPFPAGTNPYSVAVDPNGRFLFVANSIGNATGLSAYTIDARSGALTPVAGSPFAAGTFPNSVVVDPSGHYVYATISQPQLTGVAGFAINSATGALTALPNSPYAAQGGANSIAVAATN